MLRNPGIIERMSLAGARYIKDNGGHPDVSVGTMRFSLQLWIGTILIYLFTAVIGWMLGIAGEALLVLVYVGVLRYFSGGWHFRSMDVCVVFTTAVAVTLPLLPIDFSRATLAVMNMISLILILLLAPTGHGQKIKTERQRKVFKWISVGLVLLNFFFLFQLSTISFLCQSLTLITLKGGKKA